MPLRRPRFRQHSNTLGWVFPHGGMPSAGHKGGDVARRFGGAFGVSGCKPILASGGLAGGVARLSRRRLARQSLAAVTRSTSCRATPLLRAALAHALRVRLRVGGCAWLSGIGAWVPGKPNIARLARSTAWY